MRGWLLLLAMACTSVAPAPGGPEVEARREGPFEGEMVPSTFVGPPGSEVAITLRVRAAVAAPAGELVLAVPEGMTLLQGEVSTPLAPWTGGEGREFRWWVRVDTAAERVAIATATAREGGATWSGTWSAVAHPTPAPGWSEQGPAGKRRVVRVPSR